MLFSSIDFIFQFLPIVILLYYNPLFTGRNFRNAMLILASIVFFAYGEPGFAVILLFSIFITWRIGLYISDKNIEVINKKRLLIFGVCYNLTILAVFKYLGFFMDQLGFIINIDNVFNDIALPIGISFVTFQLLSYLFDVYRGIAKAQTSYWNLLLYIMLFPQLVAGPIVRYADIAEGIQNRIETIKDFTEGFFRFIYGLAKKVIIANYISIIADDVFLIGSTDDLAVTTAWIGAIAYTLQIYFDFSGYSDMAIGLGQMFGFKFKENFNYPYIARSITDFWRRWHISLSTWFRDYVYIPLGGNRVSTLQWILNLFIVWLLTGLWHGANWTFICWGLFYFLLLVIEKNIDFLKYLGKLSHVYALFMIIIGWVLFRSDSISHAITYIGYMFGITNVGIVDPLFLYFIENGIIIWVIAIGLSMPIYPYIVNKYCETYVVKIVEPIVAMCILFTTLLLVSSASHNPFIYFNF